MILSKSMAEPLKLKIHQASAVGIMESFTEQPSPCKRGRKQEQRVMPECQPLKTPQDAFKSTKLPMSDLSLHLPVVPKVRPDFDNRFICVN
jgi:hypothetical protein